MTLVVTVVLLAQTVAPPPGLLWHGAAVHPGCIRELTTELAGPRPVVAAVDLEGCSRSNRYFEPAEALDAALRWKTPDGGSFQYEYLGSLTNGVLVVRTGASGGGTGFFQDQLFLRVTKSTVLEDGKPRARDMLTLAGSETLGDRAEVTVTLAADTVTIRRREFRGAAGYGPVVTTVRRVQ